MALTYEYAGLKLLDDSSYWIHEDAGHSHMVVQIMAVQTTKTFRDFKPFPVGTLNIGRINRTILDLTNSNLNCSIDVCGATYEWAHLATNVDTRIWGDAFSEFDEYYDVETIADFIGIESAFINPSFRGAGFFREAIKGLAVNLGFSHASAFVLIANPWLASDKTPDSKDDEYCRDLTRLTTYYKKLGFRYLCETESCSMMGLIGGITNKSWESIWLSGQSKTITLDSRPIHHLPITLDSYKESHQTNT